MRSQFAKNSTLLTKLPSYRLTAPRIEWSPTLKQPHTRGLKSYYCRCRRWRRIYPAWSPALSPLPVIGVPVKTSTLSGIDSLYSIVQMPSGIPVANCSHWQMPKMPDCSPCKCSLLIIRSCKHKYWPTGNSSKTMVNDKQNQLAALGARQYLKHMINP